MRTQVPAAPSGSVLKGRGASFSVWAPRAESVLLKLFSGGPAAPLRMKKDRGGVWRADVAGLGPGTLYKFVVDGEERPDPASFSQPEGPHGPSELIDDSFRWSDSGWKGPRMEELVIYELHTGVFTEEGNFAGIEGKIPYLKGLGINAVELMPVAQFPGTRNWGYDGACPYAPHAAYGGVNGLKRLVNACHKAGLAVILDVVYNHLGPEGNYLGCYGPYFTGRYRTPWGSAVNYDGPDSLPVRGYFIGNALRWLRDFHVDALRLDAVHTIFDLGARHILAEMRERVEELSRATGRRLHLIAESDLNDPRVVSPPAAGGYGLSAQWCDDFHHALHTLLTGERQGYYEDFDGFPSLREAFSKAFVYDWRYSAHRRRMHGAPAARLSPGRFVVCSQNHDQVGNRLGGERLASLVGERKLRLAAGAVLLSPYVPLLFMGEEFAETRPFHYFTNHWDPGLAAAVREGRKRDFAAFGWNADPPDPQEENTFSGSRLDWKKPAIGMHARVLSLYRDLIALRRSEPSLGVVPRRSLSVSGDPAARVLSLLRERGGSRTFTVFNFGGRAAGVALPRGRWRALFSSEGPAASETPGKTARLAGESFCVWTGRP